jgi:raffinose/stachyose/melibiose transport system permease protein
MRKPRRTGRPFGRELVVLAVAVIWWVPFYFLVAIAIRPTSDLFNSPLQFPKSVDAHNFTSAWKGGGTGSLGRSLENSLVITCSTVLILIALGSVCAYAIARHPGKLGNALYLLFLLGIILPFQLGIIPAYVVLRHVHLIGKYAGIILLDVGLLMPLTVFLYTGFIRALPREYEEAAQVDGAGVWRTYIRVVFPLLLPVTGTVAIICGLIVWNDFFTPLIFLGGSKNSTLPLAVYSFVGEFASQWNLIFAAVIISLIPIMAFFLVAQKQLIRGFTGGIKA